MASAERGGPARPGHPGHPLPRRRTGSRDRGAGRRLISNTKIDHSSSTSTPDPEKSFISILARMQDFLTDPTQTPLFIYIAMIRKPFLAVAFAVLVFSILSSGLISLHSVDLAGAAGPYLAWVVGFLCGFSERFAQDFVMSASSRFSGSSPSDDRPSQPSPNRS